MQLKMGADTKSTKVCLPVLYLYFLVLPHPDLFALKREEAFICLGKFDTSPSYIHPCERNVCFTWRFLWLNQL